MKKISIALFISGRGTNMEAIIRNCRSGVLKDLCKPIVVLANKPEAVGLSIARALGVPTLVVESKGKTRAQFEQAVLAKLRGLDIDFIVLAGFNRILSPLFIKAFQNRIVNIHPADTKAFQGLHGYEWAFTKGLTKTKITVHFVDEGVDTGKIIMQKEVDLSGLSSLDEVTAKGLAIENSFYSEALASLFTAKLSDKK